MGSTSRRARRGLAAVAATHDTAVVRRRADRPMAMRDGRVVGAAVVANLARVAAFPAPLLLADTAGIAARPHGPGRGSDPDGAAPTRRVPAPRIEDGAARDAAAATAHDAMRAPPRARDMTGRDRAMTDDLILANARLVLDGEVRLGAVRIAGGTIASVDPGGAVPAGAIDCEGDLVAPGFVELHTDNLERHLAPRPGVDWPAAEAVLAHDAELAVCGVTTVFDALRVGSSTDGRDYAAYARGVADALLALQRDEALRISHRIHLRAEICSETLLDELAAFGAADRVGLLSLMDHTPGQRQFRDVEKLRVYHASKDGRGAEGFEAHVARLVTLQARLGAAHEAGAVAAARRLGATLASHDDTTAGQVAVSAGHGVRLAEFPTTAEAARACRAAGIAVMMGAPNLVRGGSHSGNVAAADLAVEGLLDVLSSDYVPAALMQGAMRLGRLWDDVAAGLATVTAAPARAVGLADRGRIAEGLRGDLVRIRDGSVPRLHGTWVRGARVG